MEDHKVRSDDPFGVALSNAYWNENVTVNCLHEAGIKHRDIVAMTMDRWIELLVKRNLIKHYQAETLKFLATTPYIPIGYYRQPPSLSKLKGKSTSTLCDELHVPMERKFPEFDPYVSGSRLFLSSVLEFGTQNRDGRIYNYKQLLCRNVLSMAERRKIGL